MGRGGEGIYVDTKMRERFVDKIMWYKEGGCEVGRRGVEAKSKDEDRRG
jgi:hypothetical protein